MAAAMRGSHAAVKVESKKVKVILKGRSAVDQDSELEHS
jgi:hypothetical protein